MIQFAHSIINLHLLLYFFFPLLCLLENSAIDGQLSRQPEGGGPGQPIRTTPDAGTTHL